MDRILKTVRMYDPAIDASCDDKPITEFARTRDLSALTFTPGKRPVFYHVKLIDHDLFDSYVQTAGSDSERNARAFQCAVERVENFTALSGEHFLSWVPTGQQAGAPYVSDDEKKLFSPADRQEIGAVAYWRNFLPPDIGPYFRAPPTSVAVWVAMVSLRAERTQPDAVTNSEPHKAPQEEHALAP